jgi:hypothetical protein
MPQAISVPKGGALPLIPADSPMTEVFVPRRHYPDGYGVDIDGGAIASAPGSQLLRVAACPGRARVSVTVIPAGEGATDGPDCTVKGAKKK